LPEGKRASVHGENSAYGHRAARRLAVRHDAGKAHNQTGLFLLALTDLLSSSLRALPQQQGPNQKNHTKGEKDAKEQHVTIKTMVSLAVLLDNRIKKNQRKQN